MDPRPTLRAARAFLTKVIVCGAFALSAACGDSEGSPGDSGSDPDAGSGDTGGPSDTPTGGDTFGADGISPDVGSDAGGELDSGGADLGDPGCPLTGIPADPNGPVVQSCNPIGTELAMGSAPPRRGDMAFAAEDDCGRTIMFFGDIAEPQMCGPAASIFIDDGWAFDPARGTWAEIQVQGASRPIRRARSVAVWDPMRKRLLLFGGRFRAGTTGPYTYQNDLWAFDPTTSMWEALSAQNAAGAPTGRMNTAMVMDPTRDRVLVFGGGQVSTDFMSFLVDNQTWAFDLVQRTWSRLGQTNPPSARLFHAATLDRQRGRFYIYGGGGADAFTSPTFLDDLWQLDLLTDTWTQIPTAGAIPDGRIKAEIDYDAGRDQLILFGGHDDTQLGNGNDLWTFDLAGLTWTRRIVGDTFNRPATAFCDFPADFAITDTCQPERRESHLFEIFGNRAFMYGGRTDCGLSNDTWILDLAMMRWSRVSSSFTGMTCFRSGRTDCDQPAARKCG